MPVIRKMPPIKNGKHYTLTPGKLYDFTIIKYDIKKARYDYFTYTGTFKRYLFNWFHKQFDYMFELPHSPHRMTIPWYIMKVKPSLSPIMAKQFARGLCDRIPEDCAGIIERLLVGDKIVGQGPDRYAER